MSTRRAQKKKRGGGGFVLNAVSAVVICVALILGVSVFFRVSSIEVSGSSRYSSAEIIEASGLSEGSNLVFLNRSAAENRILDALVYIGSVSVRRSLPNKVIIEVRESSTVACVATDAGYWLIDGSCRLLEPVSALEREEYVEVRGFTATEPVAGKRISVPEEDKFKVDYLEDVLTALMNADMLGDVTSIDMSTSGNPQFDYLGRFKVKLGRRENTEAKLALLQGAIAKLEDNRTGVFDLSKEKEAYFSPD